MIGTTFGPYRIDEKLGQGGMGVVYKGYDTTLQRPVAIKMIVAEHKDAQGSSSEARFMREARAASRLQHPAIVTIYQFGIEGDTQYIVMEFVEGQSLRKFIHDEPVPFDDLYNIGIQAAEALAAAHEAHIVHRDMKADNIMLTAKGQVKILDFGLAKLKDPVVETSDGHSVFKTQPGIALGTASHMSPEQAMGREVDGKSDVFSLGVVLYHMASGQLPFSGPNPAVTMMHIVESEPDPVRKHNPYVPEGLEALIEHCLRKKSAERPSAAEVAQRLKELREAPKVQPAAAVPVSREPVSAPKPYPVAPAQASGNRVSAAPVPVSRPSSAPVATAAPAPAAATPTASKAVPAKPAAAPAPKAPSKGAYLAVRAARYGVSVLFAVVTGALAVYFVAAGAPPLRQVMTSFGVYAPLKAAVAPVLAEVHALSPIKTVAGPWDFAALVLAALVLVLRGVIAIPLLNVEDRLRGRRKAKR